MYRQVAYSHGRLALWDNIWVGRKCVEVSGDKARLLHNFIPEVSGLCNNIYDAGVLMSKGVHVVLTESGSLVYLNGYGFNGKVLRLSDYVFGGIIFNYALAGLKNMTLVLDSRLPDIDLDAFLGGENCFGNTTIVLESVPNNIRSLAYMIGSRAIGVTVVER